MFIRMLMAPLKSLTGGSAESATWTEYDKYSANLLLDAETFFFHGFFC